MASMHDRATRVASAGRTRGDAISDGWYRRSRAKVLQVTSRPSRWALVGAVLIGPLGLAAPQASAVKWDRPVRDSLAGAPTPTESAPTNTSAPNPSAPVNVPGSVALSTAEFVSSWAACSDGVECARISVPADHSQPTSARIELRIGRHVAGDPAARVGVLFVNPGGPGGSAIDLVRIISTSQRPFFAELRRRFDVVGLEPRSVAGTSVSCPIKRSPDRCAPAENALLPFVDSASAARDHEAVRRLLGTEKAAYLGYSWGSLLGAQWASLYPDGLRAVILDGAVDAEALTSTSSIEKVASLDGALSFFLANCAAEPGVCKFNDGTDLNSRYEGLLNLIGRRNLRGPNGLVWTREDFEGVVALGIEAPRSFRLDLAAALDEALRNSSGVALYNVFQSLTGGSGGDGGLDRSAFTAYACRDGIVASARPDVQRTLRVPNPTRFPSFADSFVNDRECRTFPLPALPQPRFAPGAPVLVAGNRYDWRTPLVWAQRLSAQLSAPLLTYEGLGHTIVGKGLECADTVALKLLIEGVLPASLTCAVPAFNDGAAAPPTIPPTVPVAPASASAASASRSASLSAPGRSVAVPRAGGPSDTTHFSNDVSDAVRDGNGVATLDGQST